MSNMLGRVKPWRVHNAPQIYLHIRRVACRKPTLAPAAIQRHHFGLLLAHRRIVTSVLDLLGAQRKSPHLADECPRPYS